MLKHVGSLMKYIVLDHMPPRVFIHHYILTQTLAQRQGVVCKKRTTVVCKNTHVPL